MYIAALDTSGATASFVVNADTPRRRLAELRAPIGRASSDLLPRLLATLEEHGLGLAQIEQWTVGLGPGSFTGIRGGAALVKGVCSGSGAACRGLPSSLAMAAQLSPDIGESVAVLHDGRRGELLVSVYTQTSDRLTSIDEPRPMRAAEVEQLPVQRLAMLAEDRAFAELPPSLKERVEALPYLDAAYLLDPPGWSWHEKHNKTHDNMTPVYVRPAVFTAPAAPGKYSAVG